MKSHEMDARTIGELVRQYHVGFRLQPGRAVMSSGRRAGLTCRLELSGHHNHRNQCGDAPCASCIQLRKVLLTIAKTLRPIESEIFEKAGIVCETRACQACAEGLGHEKTLGVEMSLRHPLASMADSWAWIFMRRVRTALAELGCSNRAPAERLGCRPLFRAGRRACI